MNCTTQKQTQSALCVVPVWPFFHSLTVTPLGMKPVRQHGHGVRREAGLCRGPALSPFLTPHDSGRAPLSCLTEEPWQGQLLTKAAASAGSRASTLSWVCRIYQRGLFQPGIKVLVPHQSKGSHGKSCSEKEPSPTPWGLTQQLAWGERAEWAPSSQRGARLGATPRPFRLSHEQVSGTAEEEAPRLKPTGLTSPTRRAQPASARHESTGDGRGQQSAGCLPGNTASH